jgi:ATP-dependent protease ClpP protease subunit
MRIAFLLGLIQLLANTVWADVTYVPGKVNPWTAPKYDLFGRQLSEKEMELQRELFQRGSITYPALSISGNIRDEDVDTFRDLLGVAKKNAGHLGLGKRGKSTAVQVNLDSEGGSVFAAIALGRLLRQEKLEVWVQSNRRCLSSCVLILAGAVDRKILGEVGIHRPYLDTFHITTAEGQKEFYAELEVVVKEYLHDMNVPTSLYERMIRIPPEKMVYLSSEELDGYGLSGADPFHEEAWTSHEAQKLGMTKSNYLKYKDVAMEPDLECAGAVLRGEWELEDLWDCVAEKDQELQEHYRD